MFAFTTQRRPQRKADDAEEGRPLGTRAVLPSVGGKETRGKCPSWAPVEMNPIHSHVDGNAVG